MEPQKTLRSQSSHEPLSWRDHALSFQAVVQSYGHESSMVLAEKQTSVEQTKLTLIWSINLKTKIDNWEKKKSLQ